MQPGPYQQQPQYPPPYGYPQPPKKSNGPMIALAAGLAVLLAAGIGVVIALTTDDSADTPQDTATAEAGPADKHNDLPDCAALHAKLTLFPALEPANSKKTTDTQAARGQGDLQTVDVRCYWGSRQPEQNLRAEITLFRSDNQPQHNGTRDGAQYWLTIDKSAADRAEGENVLFPKSTGGNGCYGRFADGNVLVTLHQEGAGIPGGATHGPEIDQCRDDMLPKGKELVAALTG
ncbi:hypothetical protein N8J89_33905 [Crossiella sp. CA-258035]|uniref:hypothetical protein n=1 Tax=Crossiella sp. CA-258035 TaxID=2981138 RepID=UPI0024BD09C5|nr:hypothetical protein [Crossiella sp. CA-258035]WHT18066.1 hypothetical protein N8J89_33905 [Crossiella sp. CA-258035]